MVTLFLCNIHPLHYNFTTVITIVKGKENQSTATQRSLTEGIMNLLSTKHWIAMYFNAKKVALQGKHLDNYCSLFKDPRTRGNFIMLWWQKQ